MRSYLRLGLGIVAAGTSVVAVQGNSSYSGDVLSSVGIVRFGRAALAVAAIVVDYKFTLSGLTAGSEQYQQTQSQVHLRSAERLRAMCWRNGGCFIKVGQHIGALDYLLPSEYVNTMKVMHQHAPQSSLQEVLTVIREDLGQDVDKLFSSFEEQPVASASLAQVHRATRSSDGKIVAVKVQHPKVKARSVVDMAVMEMLVAVVARVFPDFEFTWLAEEAKKNLPLELDFEHEARNSEAAAKRFGHLDFLKVPAVDWSLTSKRVLTMEFCEGGFISDHEYMQKNKVSIDEVLDKLGKLYSEMIFVQGYIHCDPHPGNLFVRREKSGVQIILLDHGLYQTLSDDVRLNYCQLWQSIIRADIEDIKNYSAELGIGRMFALFACIVTGRSWNAIQQGIDKSNRSKDEAHEIQSSAGTYMPEIMSILNTVPRELLLIFKTNDLLRGIESSLQSRLAVRCRRSAEMAFMSMSRCCIRAMYKHHAARCGNSRWCRWRYAAKRQWLLVRLSVLELYLKLSDWFRGRLQPLRSVGQPVELQLQVGGANGDIDS